jgi:hypothetical protein
MIHAMRLELGKRRLAVKVALLPKMRSGAVGHPLYREREARGAEAK